MVRCHQLMFHQPGTQTLYSVSGIFDLVGESRQIRPDNALANADAQ